MARKIASYTDEFKYQIVSLYQAGKTLTQLSNEYSILLSTISGGIKYFKNSGFFKKQDSLSFDEKEFIGLQKAVNQLWVENDL